MKDLEGFEPKDSKRMKQKSNTDLEGFEPSRFVLKVCNDFKDDATPIGQQVLEDFVRYVLPFFQVHVCGFDC